MSELPTTPVVARVRSSFRGGEAKRALTATALGLALGVLISLFSRKDGR